MLYAACKVTITKPLPTFHTLQMFAENLTYLKTLQVWSHGRALRVWSHGCILRVWSHGRVLQSSRTCLADLGPVARPVPWPPPCPLLHAQRLSWASCAVCLLRAGVCCGLCTRPAPDGDMEACAAPGLTGFPGRVLVLGGNAGGAAGVPGAPQEGTLLPPSAVGVPSP